jgi:hypothetical protein
MAMSTTLTLASISKPTDAQVRRAIAAAEGSQRAVLVTAGPEQTGPATWEVTYELAVQTNIELPASLSQRLTQAAAERGTTRRHLVTSALDAYLGIR